MTRVDDWLARLFTEIERRRNFPFQWGQHEGAQDCCTLAAAVVDEITGSAHLPLLLTRYHDEPSALAYIQNSGGIEAAISTFLGQPSRLSFTQRGDVVMLDGEIQVGVCIGARVAAAGPAGVVEVPMTRALVRWAV